MKRKPIRVAGTNFAYVARGYPVAIRKKAKEHRAEGYKYRIVRDGRHRLLYIGPKHKIRKRARKRIRKKRRRRKK